MADKIDLRSVLTNLILMTDLKEMSKESLRLRHEEYKLFLQIIWSGILTLTLSLIGAAFTKTISLDSTTAILIGIIVLLGGIIITLLVFSNKFNAIREQLDKNERRRK